MKISLFLTKHWDALTASVAACTVIYFFTKHSGIGISPDSVTYFSTAANISTDFSFTNFNGLPTVDFPLGYPSLLALSVLVSGLSPLQTGPFINMALFSGVIIMTGIIIAGYRQQSALYKIVFLTVLACSPCLLEVYSMLWSETLFLFLILLFLIALQKYLRSHITRHLIIAACIAAIAFFTRYAGITLLATGGFLLLFDGELTVLKKIKHLLLFMITGSSLALINLLHNSRVAGHITGVREKAIHTVLDNLGQTGAILADWLPFIRGHETLATIVFILIFVRGVWQLFYGILQQQFFHRYETIIAAFLVVYAVFIIAVASLSRFEDLSSRLLSPLYIPLLLVGSSWIVPVIQQSARIKKMVLFLIAIFFYAGFQYNQYRLNAEAWEGIRDAGIPGYTEDSWMHSPTMAFIKKNAACFTEPVYANANDAVYFLTGLHALALPHKEIVNEIDTMLQTHSFWLVWLTDGENNDLVNLDFIRQHKKMISVRTMDDGSVYYFADPAGENRRK